jgi:hypothetical protein
VHAQDGERDVVNCGKGNDTVRADKIDKVESTCESVTRGSPVDSPGLSTISIRSWLSESIIS